MEKSLEIERANMNKERSYTQTIINTEDLNSKKFFKFVKRIADIGISSVGLLISLPVIAITAIAMKIEEPKGPVFFSQTRIGKNEKEFTMYKVRSMCVDAEKKLHNLLEQNELQGAMFKMKEDPRVTKVGKFIRKTSIDELPQLWNVLKGDMSIVGPRPPLPREVAKYTNYDKQRLLVKPGCTGLWQVNERNSTGFDGMLRRDLEYIDTMSVSTDTKIILKTFKVILLPNDVS
ncbi:UDP-phosphate galactose phosphotransferase [Floricoccus penangensis]|uniref:UDP-phosphate galactose phosphotransferase n=1 Tax=Floricoccus penangensis TaxID=1859475 RepID=A0A9Q5JF91_9LACT|nr:sugar transferase [Floricoccus penangensis]OFI45915.1 UDP-phosphate galactose phosphotransferase [Floricoccus penangensis]